MKLRTLCLTLFSTSLLLTACGAGSELSEPLTREYESYTGTFKPLGSINVAAAVTHLFETEEGDVLYAFSDRYDLDEYSTSMDVYGIVTTYEELDKPLYEVTRLTTPDEVVTEDEEVTQVEYRNPDLGVVTQIYSNWEVETNDASGLVSFKIPFPAEESEEDTEPTGEVAQDTIDLVMLQNALSTTAESTSDERTSDIKNYVTGHYPDLANIAPESITVGVDKVMGLRYKTATGDIYVFLPRGTDLFELSYQYLHMDDALRLENTNAFSAVLNAFRFITTEEADVVTPEETPSEDSTTPVSQVEISKFATLSSNFGFSMSYPSAWYYVGGSTGYSFDDEAIEDVNAQAIVVMSFNTGASDGSVRNGSQISITKKVDSRSYTLTGSAEYETVMKTMLDSIQTIKAE